MVTATETDREDIQLTGPYDSMRDYVAALEAKLENKQKN